MGVAGQLSLGFGEIGDQIADFAGSTLRAENLFPAGSAKLSVTLGLLGLKNLKQKLTIR